MPPRARPDVLSVTPYVGGEGSVGTGGRNRTLKLSSNEGAFGVPPGAAAALARAAREMHRYPDGGSVALREAIGARWKLDPARIVCGAGSDELISLLCHSYGPGGADDAPELLMSAYGFSMYEISGRSHGWHVRKAPEPVLHTDVDAILALVSPRTRMVCIANPNNPTGYLLPQPEMERLRRALPAEVLLVIDAAYAEYVDHPDYDAGAALVDANDNTVMLRTFSKVFGLGGVRLGWCYGPPGVIDVLNRARNPFNVTMAAQEAGVAALAEPGWVERSRAHNSAERARLAAALEALGFRTQPSEGNFLLADFGTAARAAAADAHLRADGIVVRAMGAYELPHMLRVTVGTAEECDAVADALRGFAERPPADA